MMNAIASEINLRRDWHGKEVETIYFGGGTPSLLSADKLAYLLKDIRTNFRVKDDAEITLEANPDDINIDYLNELFAIGINRLSLGIQSFAQNDLHVMNRAHDVDQAKKALESIRNSKFSNYSADLIYGNILSDDAQWIENIEIMLSYNVPHISAYALTVEPKTRLAYHIKTGKWPEVDEDKQHEQFLILCDKLAKAGYEQYEISNYALPGFRSRHNSAYWQRKEYIGYGPAAHSYSDKKRSWNIRNNALYMKSIERGERAFEDEELSRIDIFNEMIMTGLRLKEGVKISDLMNYLPQEYSKEWLRSVEELEAESKIEMNNGRIKLTAQALFFADGISAKLFIV